MHLQSQQTLFPFLTVPPQLSHNPHDTPLGNPCNNPLGNLYGVLLGKILLGIVCLAFIRFNLFPLFGTLTSCRV